MTTAEEKPAVELHELVELMRAKAAENPDAPEALMQGTFALYPTPAGGVMMVAAIPEGPMQGVHHYHMNPSLMQGASILFGGGSKLTAVKGLFKRRKGIGDGR